jgi:hypothetical protein
MDQALLTRGELKGRLEMSRFVEPVYFLLTPTSWIPDAEQAAKGLVDIEVPRGFVTDLASIPPLFFSLLRPDGNYAHAAVVHDFLYWEQTSTRAVADEVFRDAMRYLEVDPETVATIFNAVRLFGASAWTENKRLKESGESRRLRVLPQVANARWQEWRNLDVFY